MLSKDANENFKKYKFRCFWICLSFLQSANSKIFGFRKTFNGKNKIFSWNISKHSSFAFFSLKIIKKLKFDFKFKVWLVLYQKFQLLSIFNNHNLHQSKQPKNFQTPHMTSLPNDFSNIPISPVFKCFACPVPYRDQFMDNFSCSSQSGATPMTSSSLHN